MAILSLDLYSWDLTRPYATSTASLKSLRTRSTFSGWELCPISPMRQTCEKVSMVLVTQLQAQVNCLYVICEFVQKFMLVFEWVYAQWEGCKILGPLTPLFPSSLTT